MSYIEMKSIKPTLTYKSLHTPNLTRFAEKLNRNDYQTTSTPIEKRYNSELVLDLGDKQDSGFSEDSVLLDSHLTDRTKSNDLVQSDISTDTKSNCFDKSVVGTPIQKNYGLERMNAYFNKLEKICPKHLRIGSRIGNDHVDILSALDDLDIPALNHILGFLDDTDLLRCLEVCTQWKSLLKNNQKIRKRLTYSRHQKENLVTSRSKSITHAERANKPFSLKQLNENTSEERSPSSSPEDVTAVGTIFDRFTKAACKLKVGEQFVKCPRCQGPAKLYREARQGLCVTRSCKYNYCTLCELVFHGAKECQTRRNVKVKNQDQPINSRKSKNNLKRL